MMELRAHVWRMAILFAAVLITPGSAGAASEKGKVDDPICGPINFTFEAVKTEREELGRLGRRIKTLGEEHSQEKKKYTDALAEFYDFADKWNIDIGLLAASIRSEGNVSDDHRAASQTALDGMKKIKDRLAPLTLPNDGPEQVRTPLVVVGILAAVISAIVAVPPAIETLRGWYNEEKKKDEEKAIRKMNVCADSFEKLRF